MILNLEYICMISMNNKRTIHFEKNTFQIGIQKSMDVRNSMCNEIDGISFKHTQYWY